MSMRLPHWRIAIVNWTGSQHTTKQQITTSIVLTTFTCRLLAGFERVFEEAVAAALATAEENAVVVGGGCPL